MATRRLFDLNVEDVLEHWEVEHAIREIIANALDERLLTGTSEISISQVAPEEWSIRDYGRGLRIEHFTLNEDPEKLDADGGVIGKFGVGLKDALATFYRRGVGVEIRSSHGIFRLRQARKHSFDEIITLHVEFDERPGVPEGTEFRLSGVTSHDVEAAKSMFVKFSEEEVLEVTDYGEILDPVTGSPRVYINGVLANEEPNFLFSYNITNLTATMRRRLNRERLNVGRSTYTDRVKAILLSAQSSSVCDRLADQALRRGQGDQCDEVQWIDLARRALTLLNERRSVTYLTQSEVERQSHLIEKIRDEGHEVVVISDHEKQKLDDQAASGGPEVRTAEKFVREYNSTFDYQFIDVEALSPGEREVFDLTEDIASLVGIEFERLPVVRVAERLRLGFEDTDGVWDAELQTIVIQRRQLRTIDAYAGTLLHELAHAISGSHDSTRQFESVLTLFLGKVASVALLTNARKGGGIVSNVVARRFGHRDSHHES